MLIQRSTEIPRPTCCSCLSRAAAYRWQMQASTLYRLFRYLSTLGDPATLQGILHGLLTEERLGCRWTRSTRLSSDARCNTPPADFDIGRLIKTLGSVAMPAY